MITSNETDKILPALFELKKKIKPMKKDAKNPFYKSNYLDLPDLLENLEPLCEEFGLICSQANCHRHDDEYIVARISHATSGQFVEAEYRIGFDADPQKNGAKSTYGRRFGLKGLLGITEKDDDGNTASGKSQKSGAKKSPAKSSGGFNGTSNKPQSQSKFSGKSSTPSGGFGGSVKKEPAKTSARTGSFGG